MTDVAVLKRSDKLNNYWMTTKPPLPPLSQVIFCSRAADLNAELDPKVRGSI